MWREIGAIVTDGCVAIRSTPEYSSVDAHGSQRESCVAYAKRDVAPDRDPFAFHSVLHIVSLSVGDAIKVLPSWWIKVRGCLITQFLGFFGTPCFSHNLDSYSSSTLGQCTHTLHGPFQRKGN